MSNVDRVCISFTQLREVFHLGTPVLSFHQKPKINVIQSDMILIFIVIIIISIVIIIIDIIIIIITTVTISKFSNLIGHQQA